MQKNKVKNILDLLDDIYGIEKDSFFHEEQWQLLVAIMLSAQSTDLQVDAVLPSLFGKYKKVEDMAKAQIEEVEDVIKTIGLYHSKAKNMKKCCQQIIEEFEGNVPSNMKDLTSLAGVGRKTANLFLADAYGIPGITVDTHVNRIANRLGWVTSKNPVQVETDLKQVLPEDHWIRINIQLIRHGRAVCKARNPLCDSCDLELYCEKRLVNT